MQRKQGKLCNKAEIFTFANIIQLTFLEQINRDFLSKQPAVIPQVDPAETNGYLEFTECSFHLHLPVLMNRSEASPSVAESHREEMGGVKEGVTLYKYQFN